jgi:hypothetical protein
LPFSLSLSLCAVAGSKSLADGLYSLLIAVGRLAVIAIAAVLLIKQLNWIGKREASKRKDELPLTALVPYYYCCITQSSLPRILASFTMALLSTPIDLLVSHVHCCSHCSLSLARLPSKLALLCLRWRKNGAFSRLGKGWRSAGVWRGGPLSDLIERRMPRGRPRLPWGRC